MTKATNPYYDDSSASDDSDWGDSANLHVTSEIASAQEAEIVAAELPDWAKITSDLVDVDSDTEAPEIIVPAPKKIAIPVPEPLIEKPRVQKPVIKKPEILSQIAPTVSAPSLEISPRDDVSVPARQRSNRTREQFAPAHLDVVVNEDLTSLGSEGKDSLFKKGRKATRVNMYSGGRWKLLTLRYFIWLILGVLLIGGVRYTVFPPKPDIAKLAQTVGAQIGFNGFPVQSGEAIAETFARQYLTVIPGQETQRTRALARYLPSGVDQSWTAVSGTTETVISGPVLLQAPALYDASHATFTFGAEVKTPAISSKWVYLTVTVFADATGLVVISGPVAFVANPGTSANSGSYPYTKSDIAAQSLGVSLPDFLTAWASSNSVGISRYTQSDATPSVLSGLGGTVSYVSLSNLGVAAVDLKDPASAYGLRYAEVNVTWKANGNIWTQAYRLTVQQTSDGKWYIQDIKGGLFGAQQ
jgi:hypothetical protein